VTTSEISEWDLIDTTLGEPNKTVFTRSRDAHLIQSARSNQHQDLGNKRQTMAIEPTASSNPALIKACKEQMIISRLAQRYETVHSPEHEWIDE
jgi:hypothetical protein